MNDKKPVKVRLGEKYAAVTPAEVEKMSWAEAEAEARCRAEPIDVDAAFREIERIHRGPVIDAYVAGFDRAKALCLDFAVRFLDYRHDPPFSEDEEAEWLKRLKDKRNPPSKIMATIGEGT